jgi:GNAT superfamily N-acetyltransferase
MATIRPALPNNAGQITGIRVRTWQATYRGDLPDAFLDSLDASRREEMWRHAIDHGSPVTATFVAEDANGNANGDDTVRISGFCHAGPARDVVDQTVREIYALYVDPTTQDHGVGTALMGATTVWMRSTGYEREGDARCCG